MPQLRILLFIFTLYLPFATWAQERERSLNFGIGSRHQWDTYLSNERYKGPSITIFATKSRPTHWFDRRLYVQHFSQFDLAICEPRSEDHKNINAFFHWQVAWHYHALPSQQKWQINYGAGLQTNLGGIYNTLGGNNPASLRASVHLIASCQVKHKSYIKKRAFTKNLQIDVPLSGIMFSPDYGQSYYEIFSLGHYSHNICYANPFKAFQANILLNADLSVGKTTDLRLGYQGIFMQSDANNLKTQDFSHYFIIGYVRKF